MDQIIFFFYAPADIKMSHCDMWETYEARFDKKYRKKTKLKN